jgi:hypothetical protein
MDKTLEGLSRDELIKEVSKRIAHITEDWPTTHFDTDERGFLKKPPEWSDSFWQSFCEA